MKLTLKIRKITDHYAWAFENGTKIMALGTPQANVQDLRQTLVNLIQAIQADAFEVVDDTPGGQLASLIQKQAQSQREVEALRAVRSARAKKAAALRKTRVYSR